MNIEILLSFLNFKFYLHDSRSERNYYSIIQRQCLVNAFKGTFESYSWNLILKKSILISPHLRSFIRVFYFLNDWPSREIE